jgi:hypothetical protein
VSEQTAWDEWVALFANRDEMADKYADLLMRYEPTWKKWPTLNLAILDRWSPAGLRYIKQKAWRLADQNGCNRP